MSSSRREFLKQAAAGILTASSSPVCAGQRSTGWRIKSAIRRDETVLRHGGLGDAWHMTWGADDRQYTSMVEGAGFAGQSRISYHTRTLAISGGPEDPTFHDLPGFPLLAAPMRHRWNDTRYLGYGTLALGRHIYQFMSTYNRPIGGMQMSKNSMQSTQDNPLQWAGVKLIYSPDSGRTWHNQDGSTPVVWESWEERSRKNMVFFDEDQGTFSFISVLQMGRGYEHNRDGYVYVYSPNGQTEGTMNELAMFRVPKTRILDRSTYEYFAGLDSRSNAKWSSDINARKPVHTFPRGWVNKLWHPYSWQPSVVYNAPLGLYMMANWGTASSDDNGIWWAKPSYLGFWIAKDPWGPWVQIHEETAWTPEGDADARCFQAHIAPKWIAADGKSFWLVWTDTQVTNTEAYMRFLLDGADGGGQESITRQILAVRKYLPYFGFNVQRVDLTVV